MEVHFFPPSFHFVFLLFFLMKLCFSDIQHKDDLFCFHIMHFHCTSVNFLVLHYIIFFTIHNNILQLFAAVSSFL